MTALEQIEEAITVLESQRATLGDSIVDIAVAALQEKRAALLPLVEATGRPEQQRKQITVLFADLSGFTAMSETMDIEEVTQVMNALWQRLDGLILAHGGLIDKHIGDAVMALWGAETAQEDDPERAVRAALAMQTALKDFRLTLGDEAGADRPKPKIAMRLGLNTGPVLMGPVGTAGEFTAMGDAVNVASRLEHAAPVGGILISHDTYRHVRGLFEVLPLVEPLSVKGKEKPLRVYLVERARPRGFRVGSRGLEGVETRLIGREAELNHLQDWLYTAMEPAGGQLQLVTIVAEAGLGKSRLLYEFNNWCDLLPDKVLTLKGRAAPAMQHIPYTLWRNLLATFLGIQESDPPPLVQTRLKQGLEGKAETVSPLLGFEGGESPDRATFPVDAHRWRDQALADLAGYLTHLASQSPLLILLEDLHWADESSLDALADLAVRLAAQPVLLLCTARPAFFERRPAWGQDQPFHHHLELAPLTPEASRRLVEEILQRAPAVPAPLMERVVNQAEGNPFYIEELIKMLIEDQVIHTGADTWTIELERLAAVRVPATLTGVLQARFDSLTGLERLLLQQAAVIGRIFWAETVAFLRAGGQVTSPADPQTQAALQRLCGREMIFRRDHSTFEETVEYLFKHALLRDVTYESVLKRDRRVYHAWVADWLVAVTQQKGRGEAYAAVIADHYDQAGQLHEAAAWYRRAGIQAAAQLAHAEALRCLSRALTLTLAGDLAGQYEILLAREQILELQGQRAAQAQDLAALGDLAERLAEDRRRVEVALRRAHYEDSLGNYVAAGEAARQAITLAQAGGAGEGEAQGRWRWGRALMRQGDYAAARDQLEQALSLAQNVHLPGLAAASLRDLGILARRRGDYGQAQTIYLQALNLHHHSGDRRGESSALNNLGIVTYNRGDYAAAQQYFEESLRLKQETGDRQGESSALANLGIVAADQGRYSQARTLFEQAWRLQHEIGDRRSESTVSLHLGRICDYLGDYAGARPYFEHTLQFRLESGDPQGESWARAYLSLLSHHLGQPETARSYGQHALELARQVEARPDEARAWLCLGHALAGLNRAAEAESAYQNALALRRAMQQPHLASEALAGLARLALAAGEVAQALIYVQEILAYLAGGGHLNGTDEPFQVYLTCLEALQANQEVQALTFKQTAVTLLHARAANLEDEVQRRSFLQNVAAHQALTA